MGELNKIMEMVEKEQEKEDIVNHPRHYEGKTSIECIDSMRITFGDEAVAHFCILNSYKYLWRHKNKNGKEDLKKALWYLDKWEELTKDMSWDNEHDEQAETMRKMIEKELVNYEK